MSQVLWGTQKMCKIWPQALKNLREQVSTHQNRNIKWIISVYVAHFATHTHTHTHTHIFQWQINLFKIHPWGGFPGGTVVENLPANAGDTGSSPGLGGSHMPRSNWAREPQLLSLRVWSLCSATREAAIVRGPRTAMKSGPRLPQLGKALAQKRRPNTAKNK